MPSTVLAPYLDSTKRSHPSSKPPSKPLTWNQWAWSWLGHLPKQDEVSRIQAITSPYDFESAVDVDTGVTVIWCYAPWHESTPKYGPQLEQLAKTYAFRFFMMDMEEEELNGIASDQGVEAHPCILVFQKSPNQEPQVVAKIEGFRPKALTTLLDKIDGGVDEDDW